MNELFSLKNKVAVVTGAAGLLGSEHCSALAEAGASVVVTDIDKNKCIEIAGKLAGKSMGYKLDVTNKDSICDLKQFILDKFGHIDILVNNAGVNITQWAVDVTEETWDKVVDTNLKALFFCAQAAGKVMIHQKKGKIINVSSQTGTVAIPQRAAYCSSKGGVNQLTKLLAIEWAQFNINVNAIAPTFIETPFSKPMFEKEGFREYVLGNIPLGRIGKPDDVTGAVIYLASEASNMVTGHILLVDGGWTAH